MKILSLVFDLFHEDRKKDGRTDGLTDELTDRIQRNGRYDTANNRFSQFCERDLNCYVIVVPFLIKFILRISLIEGYIF
jgi:hypothetical protein